VPRHPLGEKAMTDAERQRKRRGRLRKERGTDDRLSDRQKLAEAQKEIWRLRQRISDLEAARALRERAALAAKTEAAKSTPPTEPDAEDPRIARLKKANSELRGKLRHMHKFYEEESSKRGIMTIPTTSRAMRRDGKRARCSVNGNRTGTGHDAKLARESLKRFRNRQRDCRNPAAQRRLFPQFGGKQGADRLAHGHARPRST